MQIAPVDHASFVPFAQSIPRPTLRATDPPPPSSSPGADPAPPVSDPLQDLLDLAADITSGNPFPGTDAADLPPTDPVEFLVWLITRAIEQRKSLNASLFYSSVNVGQESAEQETSGPFTVADLIKPIESAANPFASIFGVGLDGTAPASGNAILQIYAAGREQAIGRFINALG